MAGTFTQVYIQIVFSVKGRAPLIDPFWKDRLYAYFSGTVSGKKQKLMIANGAEDHVHLLVSMSGGISIGELVRDVKEHSTKFINSEGLVRGKFLWQEGYGAFSYSKSELHRVIQYIENQEEHHRKKGFREEYVELLNEFGISFEEKYLWG